MIYFLLCVIALLLWALWKLWFVYQAAIWKLADLEHNDHVVWLASELSAKTGVPFDQAINEIQKMRR